MPVVKSYYDKLKQPCSVHESHVQINHHQTNIIIDNIVTGALQCKCLY